MGKQRKSREGYLRAAQAIHDKAIEGIKAEIDRQGLTYYRIAKESGISSAALSRFRQPGGTLRTQSLFVLLHYLGIELVNHEGTALGILDVNNAS
jgi:transcriptional regulator with XRE-family HTH domain